MLFMETLESRALMSATPSPAVAADLKKLVADRAQFHTDVVAFQAALKADKLSAGATHKIDLLALVADRKQIAKDHGNATALAADMKKFVGDTAAFKSHEAAAKVKLAADKLHWKTVLNQDVVTIKADLKQLAKDQHPGKGRK